MTTARRTARPADFGSSSAAGYQVRARGPVDGPRPASPATAIRNRPNSCTRISIPDFRDRRTVAISICAGISPRSCSPAQQRHRVSCSRCLRAFVPSTVRGAAGLRSGSIPHLQHAFTRGVSRFSTPSSIRLGHRTASDLPRLVRELCNPDSREAREIATGHRLLKPIFLCER